MRVLLDTHVLIETLENRVKSRKIRDVVARASQIYISLASLWKIEIKQALKKLTVPRNFYEHLEQADIILLDIELIHIRKLESLAHHHGDPFDRMLIVQAQAEGLTLVTEDRKIGLYKDVVSLL